MRVGDPGFAHKFENVGPLILPLQLYFGVLIFFQAHSDKLIPIHEYHILYGSTPDCNINLQAD